MRRLDKQLIEAFRDEHHLGVTRDDKRGGRLHNLVMQDEKATSKTQDRDV
jgi:hypothetical protein